MLGSVKECTIYTRDRIKIEFLKIAIVASCESTFKPRRGLKRNRKTPYRGRKKIRRQSQLLKFRNLSPWPLLSVERKNVSLIKKDIEKFVTIVIIKCVRFTVKANVITLFSIGLLSIVLMLLCVKLYVDIQGSFLLLKKWLIVFGVCFILLMSAAT